MLPKIDFLTVDVPHRNKEAIFTEWPDFQKSYGKN